MKISNRDFFTCPADKLAKMLLGRIFCHKMNDGFVMKSRILVTEAYLKDEPECDATRAKDKSKNTQFNTGGCLHIGFTRGVMRVDVVANIKGIGEGVLIRKIDPYEEKISAVTDTLDITKEDDGVDLIESDNFWIESDDARIIMNEPQKREGIKDPSLLKFSVKSIEW